MDSKLATLDVIIPANVTTLNFSDREAQILNGSLLIDAKELAPRLNMDGPYSWQTIYRWVRQGQIPAMKVSNRVMFCFPAVTKALEKSNWRRPSDRPRRIKRRKQRNH